MESTSLCGHGQLGLRWYSIRSALMQHFEADLTRPTLTEKALVGGLGRLWRPNTVAG